MIRSGIISKPVVKDTIEKEEAGRQFLRKFTVEQIVNRVKFEKLDGWKEGVKLQ